MAVKLADTLAPMGDFEIAQAKDVSVEIGGTTKMLQTAIDNGEIGGGGSSTFVGTQAEWEALLPTEKAKYEFVDFTDDFGGAMIDDTEAHTNKVYSSSKIETDYMKNYTDLADIGITNRTTSVSAIFNAMPKAIASLGYKNRGVKVSTGLYVLKNTNAPAMLIECCFVDDADDVKIYRAETMAAAIVKGITGKAVDVTPAPAPTPSVSESFKVKIIADELNYRSGPGTSYPVKGVVTKNQIYTIVEVNGSWGKLKSGAGWISINSKYVTRV